MTAGLSEAAGRVLRGGAWNNPSRYLLAAVRYGDRAGNRNQLSSGSECLTFESSFRIR